MYRFRPATGMYISIRNMRRSGYQLLLTEAERTDNA